MFGLESKYLWRRIPFAYVARIISARHRFYTRPRISFKQVEYLECTDEIDRIEYDVEIQSASVNR